MKRFFDNELETYRSSLILLGEKAIAQVRLAMRSLTEHDSDLAARVRAGDDELDDLEVQIDHEAIRYLSLRSPVASELRLMVVGMKAGDDLERVGDEATNIAKRVQSLCRYPPVNDFIALPRMAELAIGMLREALDCFLQGNRSLALAICRRDEEVDGLNKEIFQNLSSRMVRDPEFIPQALDLMFIAKSLERIADHATNLAEKVVFLHGGEEIRHNPELKKSTPGT